MTIRPVAELIQELRASGTNPEVHPPGRLLFDGAPPEHLEDELRARAPEIVRHLKGAQHPGSPHRLPSRASVRGAPPALTGHGHGNASSRLCPPIERERVDLGGGRCLAITVVFGPSGEVELFGLAEGWHGAGADHLRRLGPLPGWALVELHRALGRILQAGGGR